MTLVPAILVLLAGFCIGYVFATYRAYRDHLTASSAAKKLREWG